uniref:Vitellogenin n=1 Tax=Acrobeloides nanus TaxID=290746 RepID=A0A914D955_9BILA
MKVYILAITCILPILAQNSLWNAIVQKEQILFDVDYNGRKFSVWKEDRGSFIRLYVTPLCELMRDSLSCQEDTYTEPQRHIFMFKVRVWNDAIVQKVQESLKVIGTEASNSNILPLPMQKIKLDIKPDVTALYADRSWRSNQDQPNVIQFGLYVKSSSSCEKIMNDAIYNIEGFIAKVRPVFEFSLTVGEQEYRNFSITGNEVASSSFYAKLNNSIDKDGTFLGDL